jgi:hypothetical protein
LSNDLGALEAKSAGAPFASMSAWRRSVATSPDLARVTGSELGLLEATSSSVLEKAASGAGAKGRSTEKSTLIQKVSRLFEQPTPVVGDHLSIEQLIEDTFLVEDRPHIEEGFVVAFQPVLAVIRLPAEDVRAFHGTLGWCTFDAHSETLFACRKLHRQRSKIIHHKDRCF